MARVSTYLNFLGRTEEALACYAKIFGTEVTMLSRYSDTPARDPVSCPPRSGTRSCTRSCRSSPATC